MDCVAVIVNLGDFKNKYIIIIILPFTAATVSHVQVESSLYVCLPNVSWLHV